MDFTLKIEELIKRSDAEAVAVDYLDLASGAEFFVRPDEPFHSASTMKISVLMELFHQAAAGNMALDDTVEIRNEFASIVDAGPFSIDAAEDSEQSLYQRIGERIRLIDLAWPMVTHSSNLATNLLVERLGAEKITTFMGELGVPGLNVLRGVEDGKAYRQGLNNTVTARGLTTVMAKLGKRQVVSPEASDSMMEILLAQTHLNGIPAGLPPGTIVANKTGWTSSVCHDTAIVFPQPGSPYALTVLTRGFADKSAAEELIAAISKACGLWNASKRASARLQ